MILHLDVERLHTLDQVRAFLAGNEPVDFKPRSREEAYALVQRMLARFDYVRLGKADKGVAKLFLAKTTGLSRAQLTRLLRQFLDTGRIIDHRGRAPSRPFERRYTPPDIRLLAEVDATLGQMAGPATREMMRREYEVFGDERFERLARISGCTPCSPSRDHVTPTTTHWSRARTPTSYAAGSATSTSRSASRPWSTRPVRSTFTQFVLSPAVNHHRPCMFAVEQVDAKGRVRRRYPHDQVATPYDRLRRLDGAERFLKPGVTFAELGGIAPSASRRTPRQQLESGRRTGARCGPSGPLRPPPAPSGGGAGRAAALCYDRGLAGGGLPEIICLWAKEVGESSWTQWTWLSQEQRRTGS